MDPHTRCHDDSCMKQIIGARCPGVFLAPKSDARSADVLKVAERWEAWVTR